VFNNTYSINTWEEYMSPSTLRTTNSDIATYFCNFHIKVPGKWRKVFDLW